MTEVIAANLDPKLDAPLASLAELEATIGHTFANPGLAHQAAAHRSWCAEHDEPSNERLEFLGDSVLGLVVTGYLYENYPLLPEGDLAKLRASVVNSATLAEVATSMRLGDYLLLGKGERATGGREKSSILADALEAIIGAVYLDGGWDAAAPMVLRLLSDRIHDYSRGPGGADYKTRLQELAARRFDSPPSYRVVGAGPDHAKEFDAEVIIAGVVRGTGQGRSKKQAEQAAARMAWNWIFDSGVLSPSESAS
jgi:ribonuclease III